MKNHFIELEQSGQSVWLDNISRELINNKELEHLIDEIKLKGVTSNPSIFQKAMAGGHAYDDQIAQIIKADPNINSADLFEELAVRDIQSAADILSSVYQSAKGADGFVSIEVSPHLAADTQRTISDAKRLHAKVNRPNLMVKIPATKEGIPAIKHMISEGVNINITLIFSQEVYKEVAEAYISGLEERVNQGKQIDNIASVASFFISRIDSMVDNELTKIGNVDLLGKIAIANAKLAYKIYKDIFYSDRFTRLKEKGAKVQRLLWASTSTKNPGYPAAIYVDQLIGKDTVNTMPPSTITAFGKKGVVTNSLENDVETASQQMNQLNSIGIDFRKITDKLTEDGVRLFVDAFDDLLAGIEKKKKSLNKEENSILFYASESILNAYSKRLNSWKDSNAIKKLWDKDYTLWKSSPEENKELSNRLGWLSLPLEMKDRISRLEETADQLRKEFDFVVLLGMGGSSLAPEVFFKTFGNKKGFPVLMILDSTHPESVKCIHDKINLQRTLFLVASKSGGTTETISFLDYFYDQLRTITDSPGSHFIAITDQGSGLEKLAKNLSFRDIFLTPEEVGGRYSALTYFGLLPAALIGIDINQLLNSAFKMQGESSPTNSPDASEGFMLGAFIGECAATGKDKLTFIISPSISSFPVWIEQLIAESTGKEGKGILPVEGEELANYNVYGDDRVFVFIENLEDNISLQQKASEFSKSGFPVIYIQLPNKYYIGMEIYRWEIATAMTGSILGINPFDQPNVQLAKTLATESMNEFNKSGKLPEQNPLSSKNGITVYGKSKYKDDENVIKHFLSESTSGNYIAVMAFLPYSNEVNSALNQLRIKIREVFKIPVTVGFGPRFLHSTGQLHKGDGNKGLFIQLTSDIKNDLEVPGKGFTFGTLITAQALGDQKALENTGRNFIRFNLQEDYSKKIINLVNQI